MPLFQTQHQHKVVLYATMAVYLAVMRISGMRAIDGVKTYDELTEIGRESNNEHLLFHVFMGQMFELFYYRDYKAILELCEKHPPPDHKRVLNTMRFWFEGVAALNVARQQPNQPKYRIIGENSVNVLAKLEETNTWNFENKRTLLQAELRYLNRDYKAAEDAYLASIESAKAHRSIHEEAMAHGTRNVRHFSPSE